MDRRRLRRLSAVGSAAGLCLLLLLPGETLGGAASKATDHYVELNCGPLVGNAGTLFVGLTISDVNGVSVGLDDFAPGDIPFVDPSAYTVDFNAGTQTGSYANGVLNASIPLVDGSGTPAGFATVQATLALGGTPQPVDDVFKDGNRQFRSSGSLQPLAIVSGTVSLPNGSSFILADGPCSADEVRVTFWGNNPTSAVTSFDANNVSCTLSDGNGVIGSLFVDVDSAHTVAFVDAFLFNANMEASGQASIVNGHLSLALAYVTDTGASAGSGSIDMTLAATGERFSYTLRSGTILQRVSGEAYDVAGSLVAPGFAPFDLGSCVLADRTTKRIFKPAKTPNTTGKPPANDLPSGATNLKPKTTLTENTKNTALDMEAPFSCLTFLDQNGVEQPIPVIKTVWFSIVGTGASVTFDTAGSGFDTVTAVYTKALDGSYVPVPGACNDDVPLLPLGRTLQSAVTFTAAAGTTYYVQIGGFPDDLNWGDLHLSVR
ncbi:MAG TPA: hypothetical protein VGQ85_02135 [Candidatus Limnocylindrales bacterium]|nr:hypothetical protein [Candidatus Limnocylindrales bacterium]